MAFGIEIVTSSHLVDRKLVQVVRTWRERLLGGYCPECHRTGWTLPWKPWVRTKQVETLVPSESLYRLGPNRYVGHPATVKLLGEQLKASALMWRSGGGPGEGYGPGPGANPGDSGRTW